jgi:1-acyl-sn-glycerol-3-phosphate acyltransferase
VQPTTHCDTFAQRSWLYRLWFFISHKVVGLILYLLYRIEHQGVEQLPTHGGVVLVSNHISVFDTLLLPYVVLGIQGLQIVWAPAKEELFRHAILRAILLSWGAFPVRRGRGDMRAMRQMLQHMRTDKMMLFPEGTRSADGHLQAGKRTIGKLIYHARPTVIPTAIVGTNRLFLPGRRRPHVRVPVSIRCGLPLDLQSYYARPDTKETAEAIMQEVMQAIAALLATIPGAASAAWPVSFHPDSEGSPHESSGA